MNNLMDVLKKGIRQEDAVLISKFPIKALSLSKKSITLSMVDVRQGRKSLSKGAIEVMYNITNGQFIVTDGYHRIVESLSKKEQYIPARIWATDYSDYWDSIRKEDLFFDPTDINNFPTLNEVIKPHMIKLKSIVNSILLSETFDLYSRNKTVSFSNSNFEWRALMELIEKANDTFNLQIEGLKWWNFNDGYGLKTQEECNKLADALESLIGDKPYNATIRRTGMSHLKHLGQELYTSDIGNVHRFIKFLRQCNGFEVW